MRGGVGNIVCGVSVGVLVVGISCGVGVIGGVVRIAVLRRGVTAGGVISMEGGWTLYGILKEVLDIQ